VARLTDAQVLSLVHQLDDQRDVNAVYRVLKVVEDRHQRGFAINLTERECDVLTAAAAGETVPPHPYREQWQLPIMRARKESRCPFCDTAVQTDTEISQWLLTGQWGHRTCVDSKAEAEPVTKERRRKAMAIGVSMSRARSTR
jgi:hypothetical protein